ncbi:LOW QUALITY PROTEIN: uncharacterized protein M6G45_016278 [Spheniscus humboldti]
MKKPNPGVAEPRGERWNREVDSDTDVEDDGLNQRFLCPKSHKTPQNTRKDPTVVMETPNPDVGGLSRGSVASSADSDTDVEDLNALPDVGAPKTRGTTHEAMDTVAKVAPAPDVDPGGPTRTNDDPDVKATVPTPDVGTPETQCPVLNVDSDTDVEDNGVIPDVGGVHGCQGASGEPDVAVTAPNPDVSSPASPGDGSDTDMEEVAPTPDVRSLRSRIWTRNQPHPDVGGPTTGSDAVVEETDPKRRKSPPKRQSWSPKSPGDTRVGGMVPKGHDSAPGTAVEAPYPDVGARQRAGETPVRDEDPAEPPDVPAVESPPLAPNAGGAGDGAGRDVGEAVAGSDTDPEEDPDLFLEPTQSFLPPPPPPPAEGAILGWDPEEPTQPFFPPEEEEEEKEQPPPEPPREPPDAWVPPAEPVTVTPVWEGTGTGAAPGGEVPPPLRSKLRRRRSHQRSWGPSSAPGGASSTPPKVLFTGVVASPGMEVALKTLGGSMATSVFDYHLVTDRVRRTVKFLCAVARGVPVVTPEWLHESARSGRVLVPGPFLVRDSQQERHFGFSLAEALRRARRHPLLQGYEVHVTPNVRPEPEHMRDIVTCSGTFLPTMPRTYGPRRLVISCEADAGCWAPALGARLPLTSPELLLTGLLRQRLQLRLFLLPPPRRLPPPPNSPATPPLASPGGSTPSPGVPRHPVGDTPELAEGPASPRGAGEVSGRVALGTLGFPMGTPGPPCVVVVALGPPGTPTGTLKGDREGTREG